MPRRTVRRFLGTLIILTMLCGPQASLLAQDATPPPGTPTGAPAATPVAATDATAVTLAASGVPNPRGIIWDASGSMLVASGGIGGTEVLPADESGAIFRIDKGCPVVVADGFKSASAFGGRYGISDIAILNGALYALGDGGFDIVPPTPAPDGVYRIHPDGSWQAITNVGAWVENNPTKLVPSDQDPGGEPYAMVSDGQALWISESNHGQILRVTPEGEISRVVDLSDPHMVPTGLKAAPDGGVYVGYLTAAPFPDGSSKVTKITADGHVTDVWTGLTTLSDVAVAPDGTLYALEMSTQNSKEPPFYRPDTGRLVRQTGPSSLEPVLTGLPQPVRMAFGPDGWLYVAMPAHDAEQKPGVILRVDPSATNLTVPASLLDANHCAPVLPPATPAAGAASATAVPGAAALPAPTVTAVTTSDGTGGGPMTIEITIRIAVDPASGGMTVPVTVNATTPAPATGGVSPESPSLPPAARSAPTPAAAASGPAVTIQNMAFNPPTLTIPKGATVTWTNSDPVAHTVTASGGAFNSGHLNPGQTYTHTFDQAGTFDYQCTYHPYMKGAIVVQ